MKERRIFNVWAFFAIDFKEVIGMGMQILDPFSLAQEVCDLFRDPFYFFCRFIKSQRYFIPRKVPRNNGTSR